MLEHESRRRPESVSVRPVELDEFYQPFFFGPEYTDDPVSVVTGATHISPERQLKDIGVAAVRFIEQPVRKWRSVASGSGVIHPMDYAIEARVQLFDSVPREVSLGCLLRSERREYYAEGLLEKHVTNEGKVIREVCFRDWLNEIFESETPEIRTPRALAAMAIRFQL